MKGTAACNTTRDYIKSAVFMANTAITLATFTVGYAGQSVGQFVFVSFRFVFVLFCLYSSVCGGRHAFEQKELRES